MICPPCKNAADWLSGRHGVVLMVFARELHRMCRGKTWCDCQHKVGRN